MIRATAEHAGIEPPEVCWSDSPAARVRRRDGRHVIELGDWMREDPERLRFSALHELGHVAHGHQLPRRAAPVAAALCLTLLLPMIVAAASAWMLTGDADTTGLALACAVWVSIALAHIPLHVMAHPREYQADAWAAQHGAPLSPRIAAQLDESTRARRILAHLLSTHPSPRRRLNRVLAATRQQER